MKKQTPEELFNSLAGIIKPVVNDKKPVKKRKK